MSERRFINMWLTVATFLSMGYFEQAPVPAD